MSELKRKPYFSFEADRLSLCIRFDRSVRKLVDCLSATVYLIAPCVIPDTKLRWKIR